ncbi:MAG: hypothetical protein V3W09_04165 [Nitrososphaerales archaeon]
MILSAEDIEKRWLKDPKHDKAYEIINEGLKESLSEFMKQLEEACQRLKM